MNNPQDDKIAELYQKIPKARPSEILDARIRQEARRQLRHGKTIHSYRWLSVAALIVLSVGVVLRIIDEVPVEQSLEESLEMMDAAPVLKEESKSIIRPDSNFAKKRAMDDAPKPRMKVQQLAAPASRPLSEPVSEAEVSAGIQAEFDTEAVSDEMTLMQKAYLPDNYCGMEELRKSYDAEKWKAIVNKLISENQLDQAECLKKLMQEHFVTGSK